MYTHAYLYLVLAMVIVNLMVRDPCSTTDVG